MKSHGICLSPSISLSIIPCRSIHVVPSAKEILAYFWYLKTTIVNIRYYPSPFSCVYVYICILVLQKKRREAMSDSSVFLNCLDVCVYFTYSLNLNILCGWSRVGCPGGGRFEPMHVVPSIKGYREL